MARHKFISFFKSDQSIWYFVLVTSCRMLSLCCANVAPFKKTSHQSTWSSVVVVSVSVFGPFSGRFSCLHFFVLCECTSSANTYARTIFSRQFHCELQVYNVTHLTLLVLNKTVFLEVITCVARSSTTRPFCHMRLTDASGIARLARSFTLSPTTCLALRRKE